MPLSLSYDPIHRYIEFVAPGAEGDSITEANILDHRWVQRMREIHQLQTAWYVYPTAEHTRFQHIVGVMHLASCVVDQLYPSLTATCDDVPSRPYVECLLRMAGLLHDVGHGPFGHFFDEHFLSEFNETHESIGAHIICHELGDMLRSLRRTPHGALHETETIDPEEIAWLIQRPKPDESPESLQSRPRWLIFLRGLLSGIYTIDNMDFVLRDAYMTGYSQQAYDLDRLLRYSSFTTHGLTIADHGMDSLIRFLMMRGELFRTVYFHRTVRAIDIALADLFRDSRQWLFPGNPRDHLDAYRDFSEWTMLVDVRSWAQSNDPQRRELGERWRALLNREIPWKMLCQRGLVFSDNDAERSSIFSDEQTVRNRILRELPAELQNIDIRVDIPRHVLRPNRRSAKQVQNFLFDSAQQRVRPLHDDRLFQYLPVSHRTCRVYGRNKQHASAVARVLDELIGPGGGDDLTNM